MIAGGASGHADVVHVHVLLDAAAHGRSVVTGAGGDLRRVWPAVPLIEI